LEEKTWETVKETTILHDNACPHMANLTKAIRQQWAGKSGTTLLSNPDFFFFFLGATARGGLWPPSHFLRVS
jgi:hypothetical protein